ncbi:MAG: hypothetical protein ACRDST_04950 [Pseudonocardiaceae bacterium]
MSAGVVKALDAALDADGALLAAWELGAKRRRPVQRRHEISETLIPLTAPTAPGDLHALSGAGQEVGVVDCGGGRLVVAWGAEVGPVDPVRGPVRLPGGAAAQEASARRVRGPAEVEARSQAVVRAAVARGGRGRG